VALEGIDGTGKTTLQRGLARVWRAAGHRVVTLREPSDRASGRRARAVSAGDPWTAALAFTEDRRGSRPDVEAALRRGAIVLLDRSFYSTLAYQGSALPSRRRRTELERMQREATVAPDVVVLLDLPLTSALARLSGRGSSLEPTEARDVLRRAARTYRQLARRADWIRLDARLPATELLRAAERRLSPRLQAGRRGPRR